MEQLFEKRQSLEKRMGFYVILSAMIALTTFLLAVKETVFGTRESASFYLLWTIAIEITGTGIRNMFADKINAVIDEIEQEVAKRKEEDFMQAMDGFVSKNPEGLSAWELRLKQMRDQKSKPRG